MNYFRNVKPKDLGELFDYKITIPGEFGGEPVKLVNGLAFNGNIRIAVEDPVSRETVDIRIQIRAR